MFIFIVRQWIICLNKKNKKKIHYMMLVSEQFVHFTMCTATKHKPLVLEEGR